MTDKSKTTWRTANRAETSDLHAKVLAATERMKKMTLQEREAMEKAQRESWTRQDHD